MENFCSYLQPTKPYLEKTLRNVHSGLLEDLIREKVTGSNPFKLFLQVTKLVTEVTFFLARKELKLTWKGKSWLHTSLTTSLHSRKKISLKQKLCLRRKVQPAEKICTEPTPRIMKVPVFLQLQMSCQALRSLRKVFNLKTVFGPQSHIDQHLSIHSKQMIQKWLLTRKQQQLQDSCINLRF